MAEPGFKQFVRIERQLFIIYPAVFMKMKMMVRMVVAIMVVIVAIMHLTFMVVLTMCQALCQVSYLFNLHTYYRK